MYIGKLLHYKSACYQDSTKALCTIKCSPFVLDMIALKVFSKQIQYQIRLEPEWIYKEINEKADLIGRILYYDDWHHNPEAFVLLDSIWGLHLVNRLADHNNRQLLRFSSWC